MQDQKILQNKIEDLVGSIEYLNDMNLTLMKRLNQTNQTNQTLEGKVLKLGKILKHFPIFPVGSRCLIRVQSC